MSTFANCQVAAGLFQADTKAGLRLAELYDLRAVGGPGGGRICTLEESHRYLPRKQGTISHGSREGNTFVSVKTCLDLSII